MSLSRNAIAPVLGLALAASMLVACSAPDADTATQEPADAVALETTPVSDAVAATEEADPAATPVDLPTGPQIDRIRAMVGMGAGLYALDEACAPGRSDLATVRDAAINVPGREQMGLSDAQMYALFDAEYAKNRRKLDALSDAKLAASCKEVEDMAAAAAQALGK